MKRRNAWLPLCFLLFGLTSCEKSGAMQVSGVNPPAGHTEGGQPIEITGKNFRQDIGYAVYFGKDKAKEVHIRSTEKLVATSPKGAVGKVDVTVRADDGNAFVIKEGFRYEDMAGSVVEGIGGDPTSAKKGNLAY